MSVIEAVGVTKTYRSGEDERVVLRDVSLSVPAGGFVSVMGPSGSGKSTLLHILGGIDRSHTGTVTVDGVALSGCDDDALAKVRRHSIGFVFQAFNLVPVLTALENVSLAGIIDGRSTTSSQARALELLDLFGVVDSAGQRPVELSGGEQQRVAIARALFLEPAVVLADEPTGNLDSTAGAEVVEVLTSANRYLGQSIVMVTHDPAVAVAADEVVVVRDSTLGETLDLGYTPDRSARHRKLLRWLDASGTSAPSPRERPLVVR